MLKRCGGTRGSVLLLMPVGVLIMLILGAITIDLVIVRVAQHDLIDAATDAANDAVAVGFDEAMWRVGAGYRLDEARVDYTVYSMLGAKGMLDRLEGPPEIEIVDDDTVTVRLARRVPHVFAKALPGAPHDQMVRATVTAVIQRR